MSRHRFTRQQCSAGGTAAAGGPGGRCPRCHKVFENHAQLAGHLGLHVYADRYTAGDMKRALRSLQALGTAATDPVPQNGAFAKEHQEAVRVQSLKKEQTQ